jgi:hypothetical protein
MVLPALMVASSLPSGALSENCFCAVTVNEQHTDMHNNDKRAK